MPSKGVIVDYGMGNLLSVKKKFDRIGCEVSISQESSDLLSADFLVLPGVGHFEAGVRNLKESGLWITLNELVLHKKKPILGICLGLQLMCLHSEEGDVEGFGWFNAQVKKFQMTDTLRFKVPHVGWNYLNIKNEALFAEIETDHKPMYFVHSYYVQSLDPSQIAAQSTYEITFDAVLVKDNIVGCQFHPEKSHGQGEQLITAFLKNYVHV